MVRVLGQDPGEVAAIIGRISNRLPGSAGEGRQNRDAGVNNAIYFYAITEHYLRTHR